MTPNPSAREAILGRVRAALAKGRKEGRVPYPPAGPPVPPPIPEDLLRQIQPAPAAQLWALFVKKVTAIGDQAILTGSIAQAREAIAARIDEWKLSSGIADRDALAYLSITDGRLGKATIAPSGDRETAFQAGFGITLSTLGVAETGSVMVRSGEGRARLTSLAPPVHFALLPLSLLLPDLADVQPRVGDASATCSVWITGSSRSADLEGILIHGVHGPGKLLIVGIENA